MRREWRTPSNVLSAVSAFAALLALIVSVRACSESTRSNDISRRALELSEAAHVSERSITWRGSLEGDDRLKIVPSDPAFLTQELVVLFPTAFGLGRQNVTPPDWALPLAVVKSKLVRTLRASYPPISEQAQVVMDARLPVALLSVYTAKGATYQDRSVCEIRYRFVIPDSDERDPYVEFTGLKQVTRVLPQHDPEQVVTMMWDEYRMLMRESANDARQAN